jgi:hypothetical protein
MQLSYKQVMALQADMKSAGSWVSGGRLTEPTQPQSYAFPGARC